MRLLDLSFNQLLPQHLNVFVCDYSHAYLLALHLADNDLYIPVGGVHDNRLVYIAA